MKPTLAIGWDVGGWAGKKQGLAAFIVRPGRTPELVAPPLVRRIGAHKGGIRLADFVALAGVDTAAAIEDLRLVIAIDAPLGFPKAFRDLLGGNPEAGWRGGRQLENPYALRETDRHIEARFKLPLSAPFDKLGNNATVAMHHVARWRVEDGLQVPPFDRPDGHQPAAIEVYPAIVRQSPTGSRPDWYRELAGEWATRSDDAGDAVVCAALALAWAHPYEWGLPRLQGPTVPLPGGEGWIYYPKASQWR